MARMVVLEIVIVAVVIFAIAAFLTGRIGGMSAAPPDAADNGLPVAPLASSDLDRARFGLAFRGYQMAEVDAVLDRVRDQLAQDQAELADLRAQRASAPAASSEAPVEDVLPEIAGDPQRDR
jgi:DivIVA domain-containing protein